MMTAGKPTVFVLDDDPAIQDSILALLHAMKLPGEVYSSVREFLDVRDGVAAMTCMAGSGRSGEVYNICSGEPCRISELLQRFIENAETEIEVRDDESLYRPLRPASTRAFVHD